MKNNKERQVLTIYGWRNKAENDYWKERDCGVPTILDCIIYGVLPQVVIALIIYFCLSK